MTILQMNRLLLAVPVLLTGCATTGATLGSGVGDRMLEHPPYYAGAAVTAAAPAGSRIGHLPIAYQRGAAQSPIFDAAGGAGTPMRALLGEMNAFLDSLGASVRVSDQVTATTVDGMVPPDVRFGCATASGCASQTMYLAVGRPSGTWDAWSREVMRADSVSKLLVVTLEVGHYLPRQSGWRGAKSVELGTDHTAHLPWLTSLETPVSVLQFTGALMDDTGRARRIGAEGIQARRTRLAISALGGQEIITDDDVQRVREQRREDLPGEPLAWRVALVQLVEQLTGRRASGASAPLE